ncbi:MAG: cytochrome c biogenesis protein CcdA [Armatimonadetes bacterium]|nr:cytochrome c biogenesis protein CcdA [Armatimonadota bacterium]
MGDLAATLERALSASSPLVVPLVFVGGAATGLNPCVYPTIPVLIGYITGQKSQTRLRGLALALTFVLGLALTYAIMGATASFVGSVLGLSRAQWLYVVAAVCIVAGAYMAGLLPVSLGAWVPAESKWSQMSGFVGAFVLGVLFGLVASPCAVPILTLIIALIASKGQVAYGTFLMFIYALGHGLPLVILGVATSAVTSLGRVTKYSAIIQKMGGWILIAVGIYLIWRA